MFDQASWDVFVECVYTNKLFESFDREKILYIVSRHYDTLTSPTFVRNYLEEYGSAKNFSTNMSHYIKQYIDSINYELSAKCDKFYYRTDCQMTDLYSKCHHVKKARLHKHASKMAHATTGNLNPKNVTFSRLHSLLDKLPLDELRFHHTGAEIS